MPEIQRWKLGVVLLFLLFVSVRFIFPNADPAPFKETDVSWHDEGWVHNARSAVLFGKWRLDEYNPMYISPVFTFFEFISFKIFGVNTFSARLVSMLLGSFSILFLFLFVRNTYGYKSAIISLILFGGNYFYLMFNRVAMLETTMIFFIILSIWLYQKGLYNKIYCFISGCSAILAYFTKSSAAFLIIALTMFSIIRIFIVQKSFKRKVLQECLSFLGGLLFAGCLWAALWLIPSGEEYLRYNLYLHLNRNMVHSFAEILLQLATFPSVNNFFVKMPIISALSLLSLFGIFSSFTLKRSINEFDILLFLWILVGILQLLLTGAYGRRMLFLVPAMAILATRAFSYPFLDIIKEIKDRVSFKWQIVLFSICFYLTYALSMAIVCLAPLRHNRILLSLLLSIPVFIILIRNKCIFEGLAMRICKKKVMYLAITASFLINAGQFSAWAVDRSYSVMNASKEIGNILPEKTKVQGGLALALSLENKIMPFFISEGYGNFFDMLHRDDIRYILTSDEPYLGSENKAMHKLVSFYPKSKVIKKFDLNKAEGENLSVVLLEKYK